MRSQERNPSDSEPDRQAFQFTAEGAEMLGLRVGASHAAGCEHALEDRNSKARGATGWPEGCLDSMDHLGCPQSSGRNHEVAVA